MGTTLNPSRLLKALAIIVFVLVEFKLYAWWTGSDASFLRFRPSEDKPFTRSRVFVASSFGAHDDVYMSVVDTLERLLPSSSIKVYTRGLRYGLGTQVLSQLGIYRDSKYHESDEMLGALDSSWDGLGADLVVIGTCEIDMEYWSTKMFNIWLARPQERKFDLVCIVHNANDFGWAQRYSGDWARVGALSMMPISPSVSRAQIRNLRKYADEPARYHLGYSAVQVHAHIPILPIERLPSFNAHGVHPGSYAFSLHEDGLGEQRALAAARGGSDAQRIVGTNEVADDQSEYWQVELDREGERETASSRIVKNWGRKDGKMLRDAVIQGNFETARRDYVNVFADLLAEILVDPAAWGYLPSPASSSSPFVAANADAFRLHMAGNGPDPDFIPPKLAEVVQVHKGLSYPDFFSLMGSMDVALPSFNEAGGYYDNQASSTVAMSQQCEVPLLVTPRILSAYSYLLPTTTILRPQSMREISAIRALRTSTYAPPARSYLHDAELTYSNPELFVSSGEEREEWAGVEREAMEMIARGWRKKESDWRKFKRGIREVNEDVVKRLLRS